jgi:type II secretory pathway predicted ATPase ExeA
VSPRHHLNLEGAAVMQTEAFLLAERAARDVAAAQAMGVIHGVAGTGKTFAVQAAVDALAVPACCVQFPSRPSMLRVAQQLLHRLTGRRLEGNRFELSDRLVELLAERDRLIVVDEAQWLTRECIEYLRHLHDDPATRFGMLLVGGDGCWHVLSREPMLRSRLYRRVTFTPLGSNAVQEVIPRYHRLYDGADPELLLAIDDRYAHGLFRHWAAFTHTAAALCADHDQSGVTADVAHAVFALHGARRAA